VEGKREGEVAWRVGGREREEGKRGRLGFGSASGSSTGQNRREEGRSEWHSQRGM
jgi:hypothetical protein